jgi:anti-sigma regulatory factor (Ser/Thr protein kinase)
MTLVEAAPPAELIEIGAWTVRGVDDVANVRALLQQAISATQVHDASHDRVILVASELATNAVRHGSEPVTVRLLCDGTSLAVDVVDHRPDAPPVVGKPSGGTGGFGLLLAARAAAALGWSRSARTKHVWAQFA